MFFTPIGPPDTTSHPVHLQLAKCQVWRKQFGHEASHVLSNPNLGEKFGTSLVGNFIE